MTTVLGLQRNPDERRIQQLVLLHGRLREKPRMKLEEPRKNAAADAAALWTQQTAVESRPSERLEEPRPSGAHPEGEEGACLYWPRERVLILQLSLTKKA